MSVRWPFEFWQRCDLSLQLFQTLCLRNVLCLTLLVADELSFQLSVQLHLIPDWNGGGGSDKEGDFGFGVGHRVYGVRNYSAHA